MVWNHLMPQRGWISVKELLEMKDIPAYQNRILVGTPKSKRSFRFNKLGGTEDKLLKLFELIHF